MSKTKVDMPYYLHATLNRRIRECTLCVRTEVDRLAYYTVPWSEVDKMVRRDMVRQMSDHVAFRMPITVSADPNSQRRTFDGQLVVMSHTELSVLLHETFDAGVEAGAKQ